MTYLEALSSTGEVKVTTRDIKPIIVFSFGGRINMHLQAPEMPRKHTRDI